MDRPGLSAYENVDLSRLDDSGLREFWACFEAITGIRPDATEADEGSPYEPWWVRRFNDGAVAWMFLEAYPGYDVPDVSAVRVFLFDSDWQLLGQHEFRVGYREFLTSAEVSVENPLRQALLVLETRYTGPFVVMEGLDDPPDIEQSHCQRQYYAVRHKQLVLVCLEDANGAFERNDYRVNPPWKGPPLPVSSREGMLRNLTSRNPARQLAALVWLAGKHSGANLPDLRTYEAVRNAPQTRKLLQRLVASSNLWISGYAALVHDVASPTTRQGWLYAQRTGVHFKRHGRPEYEQPESIWKSDLMESDLFRNVFAVGILLPFGALLLLSFWALFGTFVTILFVIGQVVLSKLIDLYQARTYDS